jgi:TRAP-type C4-dicarboxylate transport system permease small subunit
MAARRPPAASGGAVLSLVAWITRANRALAAFAGLLTAVITVIVCADVASRTLANRSIDGASEIALLLLVALVFLGFAGAESKGENFSVTLVVRRLPHDAQRWLYVATTVISLAAVSLLAWFSWTNGMRAMASDERSYGVISFPIWPSRLLIALGLTMFAVQLVAQALKAAAGDFKAQE